ncbi:MAG: hypothetical protein AVDCRST_MAG93-4758 [uncultured Chloroflexia bacterium]|uniref:Uncharacterized protein n=1 Tax=uncultured Chloroflexia bacterium TaxID=1672391 RepID=A0A6J4KEC2_9CHLR|nr:MAG: hypothetical protein AVDCRST_MAG93-4758 [uncultured Chloroflexia bacterium]
MVGFDLTIVVKAQVQEPHTISLRTVLSIHLFSLLHLEPELLAGQLLD